MELGLKDKVALVTAASKGLGLATVESLLQEGANVAFCSSSEKNVKKTFDELNRKFPNKVFGFLCDLNLESSIEQLVANVISELGNIQILVNNCGGPPAGYFENLTEKEWDYSYYQVLMSAVRMTKLVLPNMKEKKWGRIINITSQSVKQPVDNLLLSNTFRSGLTAFAKTISNQYAPYNVTINNVAPGNIYTERIIALAKFKAKSSGTTFEEAVESMTEVIPAKRFGNPKELGDLIAFLASENASYITGTTIQVDGGIIKSTY